MLLSECYRLADAIVQEVVKETPTIARGLHNGRRLLTDIKLVVQVAFDVDTLDMTPVLIIGNDRMSTTATFHAFPTTKAAHKLKHAAKQLSECRTPTHDECICLLEQLGNPLQANMTITQCAHEFKVCLGEHNPIKRVLLE